MSGIVDELRPLLIESGYMFREHEGSILIELPNGFGELLVCDLENNDDLIGLLDSEWHTHSDCLGPVEVPRAIKVKEFVSSIFAGEYFLIEEREPGKSPAKMIEDDLESYKKYLPDNTTYRVFN